MRFALVRIRGKRSGGFLGVGRFSRGDQFCVCARDRREESERQRRVVKSQFLTVRRAVVVTVVVASRDDRRPISRLRAAAATMMRRASLKKKVGYLPNQSKGTFWCGFVWAKTRLIRSTKKDVSSSSSCLPCKFWNEPPLDFFMAAPLSFSSSLFALFSKRLVVAVAPPPLQQVVKCDNTQRRGSFLF